MGQDSTDAAVPSGFRQGAKSADERLLSPVLRISLILGVCAHLLGFLFFRVISKPLPEREAEDAFVQFVSPSRLNSSEALEEQAALLDTAPLFIPGQWNAVHNVRPPIRDLALQRFPYYQPEIDLRAQLRPERSSIGETFDVATPEDSLALRYWDLFAGFGRRPTQVVPLDSSGSLAEFLGADGQVVQSTPTGLEGLSNEPTDPVTFILRIEAGGRAIGFPTLVTSSQNESFDTAARDWLKESGKTAALPAGLYEIRIYP